MENWRKIVDNQLGFKLVSAYYIFFLLLYEHHQISSCTSYEPSLNWSLVLDKLIMEFTEMTQLGSFSTVLTRLAELWFEAESV